jgi:NAD(P)-dependent dehydrogenase (short-subunit alcohol dehydrogenase family)
MPAESALIVGVGAGLGWGLVERFAAEGFDVAAAARQKERLDEFKQLDGLDQVACFACDVTREDAIEELFADVLAEHGVPDVVVFNAGNLVIGEVTELSAEDFEYSWRVGCLGGFLVGRAAARAMLERGSGTIIFTGATAALRGGARFASLAVPKVGLRALSQSMARELGPKGIHVAHVIIDGGIASKRPRNPGKPSRFPTSDVPDSVMQPGDIAEIYYQLHRQPRSTWSQEMDLRPWVEKF